MLIFVQVAASMASVWFGGQVINNLIGIAGSGAAGVATLTFNAAGFIIADIASALSWTLMNYVERYSYSIMSSNCYLEYNRQQASLDLQQLDDESVRQKMNLLAQEGYAWKPSNFTFDSLHLGHSAIKAAATLVAVMTLSPWYAVIIVLSSIPSVLTQKRTAEAKWGIWQMEAEKSQILG
jgi:ABC-type multidrug transport system fused ATPase/permease subunit